MERIDAFGLSVVADGLYVYIKRHGDIMHMDWREWRSLLDIVHNVDAPSEAARKFILNARWYGLHPNISRYVEARKALERR